MIATSGGAHFRRQPTSGGARGAVDPGAGDLPSLAPKILPGKISGPPPPRRPFEKRDPLLAGLSASHTRCPCALGSTDRAARGMRAGQSPGYGRGASSRFARVRAPSRGQRAANGERSARKPRERRAVERAADPLHAPAHVANAGELPAQSFFESAPDRSVA